MKLNKRLLNTKGFTISEIIIAIGITSIIIFAAGSIIIRVSETAKKTSDRLIEEVDNDLSFRLINNELSNSYVERSGFITCDNITNAPRSVTLENDGQKYSILHSISSSVVGTNVSKDTLNSVITTEPELFNKGDIVLLSELGDPTNRAFFTVGLKTGIDIVLESDATIDLENSNCSRNGTNLSLDQVLSNGTLFYMHKIGLATYTVQTDAKGIKNIIRSYTKDSISEPFVITAFDHVKKLVIKTEFIDASIGGAQIGTINRTGRFKADLELTAEKLTLMNTRRDITTKTQASYSLLQSSIFNYDVQTQASTIEVIFPTCSISMSPISGYTLANNSFTNSGKSAQYYLVTASISEEITGAGINVSLSPQDATSQAFCENKFSIDNSPNSKNKITNGSNSFFVSPNNNANRYYVCAISGELQARGTLTYFDTMSGRPKDVKCSSQYVSTPTYYYFTDSSNLPSCNKNDGTIDLGSTLLSSNNKPGPTLTAECKWNGAGNDYESCDFVANQGNNLHSIKLLPANIILKSSISSTATIDSEVTCD